MPITEISLAAVADQYLTYLTGLAEPDRDLLARFVSVGGRLLLLKSRLLLPREQALSPDDAVDASDLMRALLEFRTIRRAAELIEERSHAPSYPRGVRPAADAPVPPLIPPTAAELAEALRRLLAAVPTQPVPESTVSLPERVSVASRLSDLRGLLASRQELDWADVAGATVDSVVATFLAVLELLRRGEVTVAQDETFGPIHLIGTPQGPSEDALDLDDD